MKELANLNVKISLLLHETQKERGMSAGYIGSNGVKFKDNLTEQKELTNKNINEFKKTVQTLNSEIFPLNAYTLISKILKELATLEEVRNDINNLKIKSSTALVYYTNINSMLLDFIALTTTKVEKEKDTRTLIAYYNFLMAKERVGLERGIGSNIFASKSFALGAYEKYAGLVYEQQIFIDGFLKYSSDENKKFFLDKINHSSIDELKEIRKNLLSYVDNKDVKLDLEPTLWFSKMTEKINILKQIDDYLSQNLIQQIEKDLSTQTKFMYFLILVSLSIIALIIYFIIFFNSSISRAIDKIYKGIEQFMKYLNREINELEYIDLNTRGELGKLAKMVNFNIDRINGDLEKDLLCVGEATITLDKFQKGYYSCRVNSKAANPQVQTLAKTINKMLDTQQKINSDILKVLAQYSNYNYLNSINNNDIYGELKELVDGINHLGDYGTQFGKLIEAYKLWHDEYNIDENPIDELTKMYIRINELCEENPEVLERCRNNFKLLEEKDEYCMNLWNRFKELSLEEFKKTYDLLGTSFDSYKGEAFYSDKTNEVLEILE